MPGFPVPWLSRPTIGGYLPLPDRLALPLPDWLALLSGVAQTLSFRWPFLKAKLVGGYSCVNMCSISAAKIEVDGAIFSGVGVCVVDGLSHVFWRPDSEGMKPTLVNPFAVGVRSDLPEKFWE